MIQLLGIELAAEPAAIQQSPPVGVWRRGRREMPLKDRVEFDAGIAISPLNSTPSERRSRHGSTRATATNWILTPSAANADWGAPWKLSA